MNEPEIDLSQIRNRHRKASRGPWQFIEATDFTGQPAGEVWSPHVGDFVVSSARLPNLDDAIFIAHAKKDVGDLLVYIDYLARKMIKIMDRSTETIDEFETALRDQQNLTDEYQRIIKEYLSD